MRNTWKSTVLAMLTASALYANEPVNTNHADWLQAIKRTEKIREDTPKKMAKLEKEVFNQAVEYHPTGNDKIYLPNYKDINQAEIVDVFLTNAHYTTTVVTDLANRLDYDWTKVDLNRKKKFIERKALELKENPQLQDYAKQKVPNGKIDCRLLSSIAAALHLNLAKGNEIELVTGLFFDKEYAPTGIGHQWAKAGNTILDPAIQVPTDTENYVPLMAVRIREENGKYILTPKIYCLAPEMEKRIK